MGCWKGSRDWCCSDSAQRPCFSLSGENGVGRAQDKAVLVAGQGGRDGRGVSEANRCVVAEAEARCSGRGRGRGRGCRCRSRALWRVKQLRNVALPGSLSDGREQTGQTRGRTRAGDWRTLGTGEGKRLWKKTEMFGGEKGCSEPAWVGAPGVPGATAPVGGASERGSGRAGLG